MGNEAGPYLIIGLGNPGREYQNTRHNIGFMAIDQLCRSLGIAMTRVQSRALVASGTIEGQKVILAKPQTFMNLSGQAVGGLVHFYKTPIERLIIAHDDIDLPLGTIRIRPGGGSAGQKGMGSIIQQLGTQEFARLRLGVGRPPGQKAAANYVLQRFTNAEQEFVAMVLDRAASAVRTFISEGLDAAMNKYNGSLP